MWCVQRVPPPPAAVRQVAPYRSAGTPVDRAGDPSVGQMTCSFLGRKEPPLALQRRRPPSPGPRAQPYSPRTIAARCPALHRPSIEQRRPAVERTSPSAPPFCRCGSPPGHRPRAQCAPQALLCTPCPRDQDIDICPCSSAGPCLTFGPNTLPLPLPLPLFGWTAEAQARDRWIDSRSVPNPG